MRLNKKLGRWIAILLVNLICMLLFSTLAFAQTVEPNIMRQVSIPETTQTTTLDGSIKEVTATEETQSNTITIDPEAAVPLTPEGNLTLVDDIKGQTSGDKQFITVMTKTGKTFYIVIDRAGDKQNVYFLNLVDEADLMALIDNKNTLAGVIATDKAVLAEPTPTGPIMDSNPVKETNSHIVKPKTELPDSSYLLVALLAILLAVGGILWFVKFSKGKSNTKGRAVLDEYSFDEDEDETMDKDKTHEAAECSERLDGDRE